MSDKVHIIPLFYASTQEAADLETHHGDGIRQQRGEQSGMWDVARLPGTVLDIRSNRVHLVRCS